MDKNNTYIELIEGGNVFKQGDRVTLVFKPLNYKGELVDLAGKTIRSTIRGRGQGIMFEGDATWDFAKSAILQKVPEALDYGTLLIEFLVTDSADPTYRVIFPSNESDGRLKVNPSADNMDVVGVKMTTVSQLRAEQENKQQAFESTIVPQVQSIETEQQRLQSAYDAAAANLTQDSEVILARGNEPSLTDRLDLGDQRLAEKINKGNVSITDINKNLGGLDETYMTDEFLQQMAGTTSINAIPASKSITSDKFAEKAVYPFVTSFAKGGGGVNLFDGVFVNARLTGAETYVFTISATAKVAIVKVKPNTTYNIYKSLDTDIFRVGAFKTHPIAGDQTTSRKSGTGSFLEITTFNDENYLAVYVSSETQGLLPSKLQVSEGTGVKEYVSPNSKIIIDLSNESIPPISLDMTKFAKRSNNLFDGEYQHNKIISAGGVLASGTIVGLPNARTTNKISCNAGKKYTISGEFNRNTFLFVDEAEQFVSVVNSTTVTVPETAVAMYVYYSTDGSHKKMQIEEGVNPTTYKSAYIIDENALPQTETQSNQLSNRVILGDDGSRYVSPGEFIDGLNDAILVYAEYDKLLALSPHYTKASLGVSELGVPIYQYDFKTPPTFANASDKLKIYLNTGTHGQEKYSVRGSLRFVKDLCHDWENQQSLRFLLANVHLIVIPILNPDGYNAGTRVNGNGIDLNRHFPTDWVYNDNPNNYTGEAPATESETQIMMAFLNNHPDIYFAIDFHNYNPYPASSNTLMWVGADNPVTQNAIKSWGQGYDIELRKRFLAAREQDNNLIAVRDRNSLGTYNGGTGRYMESLGLKAVTLEAVENIDGNPQDANVLNAEGVGNFILDMVRAYRVLI